MPARPRLKNHAQPLRRSPTALQFGLVPHAGLIVEGLSQPEITILSHLDGRFAEAQLYAAAQQAGITAPRLDRLLAELRTHHLLVEEPTDRVHLGRLSGAIDAAMQSNADAIAMAYEHADDGLRQLADRTGRRVGVRGHGGLPTAIAAALRAGGVGRVDVGTAQVDALEQSWAGDPALPCAAGARAKPSEQAPDLVVLVARSALVSATASTWLRHGIPHLPVLAQGARVVIGPLIQPGNGPCLNCLDLDRRERDPAWPSLLSQLAPPLLTLEPAVDSESTLTAITAGLTAMIVQGHLDGQPQPVGVSLELSLPWPRLTHREWAAHPACPCTRISADGGPVGGGR